MTDRGDDHLVVRGAGRIAECTLTSDHGHRPELGLRQRFPCVGSDLRINLDTGDLLRPRR